MTNGQSGKILRKNFHNVNAAHLLTASVPEEIDGEKQRGRL